MNDDVQVSGWHRIENTEAERILLLAAVARQLQHPSAFRRSLPWIAVAAGIGLLSWLLQRDGELASVNGLFVLLLLSGVLGAQFLVAWGRLMRAVRAWPSAYGISMDDEGIHLALEAERSSFPWRALRALEQRNDGLLILLQDLRALFLPVRCFASRDEADAWRERIEQASGLRPGQVVPAPSSAAEAGLGQALGDLGSNLRAGCLFALFRASAVSLLRVSVGQIMLVAALSVLLGLLFDLAMAGTRGSVNWYALPYAGFGWLLTLLCAWAVAGFSPRRERVLAAVLAMASCSLVLSVPQMLSILGVSHFPSLMAYGGLMTLVLGGWLVLALIVALVRTLEISPDQRMGAVLGVVFTVAASVLLGLGEARLWVAEPAIDERADTAQDWRSTVRESVLYSQPAMLDKALAALEPGTPGKPEIFLLALAGYGQQDVFRREVDSVETLFAERFSTAAHSLVLANNPGTLDTRPIASVTALRRSLAEIGRKMNPEEDVLFLFMTSHGAADFRFSLELWPYRFDELTPQTLLAALDAAGIRNRVIVVSACYSGGFVPALAGPRTLMMSASRADRNSHGCSHEAEWTFFGKAYFNEALRQTRNFEQAFDIARKAITQREDAEGLVHSEPQIQVGSEIRPVLERLAAQLERDGQTLAAGLHRQGSQGKTE